MNSLTKGLGDCLCALTQTDQDEANARAATHERTDSFESTTAHYQEFGAPQDAGIVGAAPENTRLAGIHRIFTLGIIGGRLGSSPLLRRHRISCDTETD